jgi:transcriptional regulator GlxA family with amidase domain
MHEVAVLARDGVVPFDLAVPVEVFGRTRLADAQAPYRVRVCAPTPQVDAGAFALRVPFGLEALTQADTVVIPGVADPFEPVAAPVIAALRSAHAHGARLASTCVGAFALAATGLLDGLTATTHWRATDELARRYPAVRVDPHVLFVDHGQLLTSAGAAAGLDLCLHMVRRDFGAAVAADAARVSVMPLEREGGQAQFIVHSPPNPEGSTLAPLLLWMEEHAELNPTLDELADQAGLSPRTLIRRFRAQTGTTPAHWLIMARIRRAQHLHETTDASIERIAGLVGFGAATFRDQFRRRVGISPHGYRRAFYSEGHLPRATSTRSSLTRLMTDVHVDSW